MSIENDTRAGLTPAEAVARTGLSIDTLRYYERVELLGPVRRNAAGRRVYSEGDLALVGLLICLRKTGMGIAELRRFVDVLREADQSENPVTLLTSHRDAVRAHIAQMQAALRVLEGKIAHYGGPVVDDSADPRTDTSG